MSLFSNLKLDAQQLLLASLPSDLPDSFFECDSAISCGPSDVNGAASAVTAPSVPGPGVRILVNRSSRPYALALQISEPQGFWCSACPSQHGMDFSRCFAGLRS